MNREQILELVSLIVALIRGGIIVWFYRGFAVPRWNNGRGLRKVVGKYGIIVCWALWILLSGEFWNTAYDEIWIIFKQLTMVLVLFGMSLFFYRASVSKHIFLSVILTAISGICLVFAVEVSEAFSFIYEGLADEVNAGSLTSEAFMSRIEIYSVIQITAGYLFYLVLMVVVLLFIRRGYREKDYELHKNELVFLVAPSLAGLITSVMFKAIVYTIRDDRPINIYDGYPLLFVLEPVVLTLLLVTIVSGVFLFQNLIIRTREREHQRLMERELEQMQERIEETDRINEDARAMRHDMKNHLSVISGLVSELDDSTEAADRLKEYLESLQEDVFSLDRPISTCDPTVDTLLQLKISEVKPEEGIRFDLDECVFAEKGEISSYDICVLLGNALDNAIRACRRNVGHGKQNPVVQLEDKVLLSGIHTVPDLENVIKIKTKTRGRLLFIEMSNPCQNSPACRTGEKYPKSDRVDTSGHGYGFINMERVARKYNGDIDWSCEGGVFTLMIMLQS